MIPGMALLSGNWLPEKSLIMGESGIEGDEGAAPARKKRQQCAVACIPCSKAKSACDDVRPCSRCIRQNNIRSCVDKVQSWYSASENGQLLANAKRPPGAAATSREDAPLEQTEPVSKKRRQLSKGRACLACFRSKTGCDDARPCARCVRVNGGNCVDKYLRTAPASRLTGLVPGVLDLLMTGQKDTALRSAVQQDDRRSETSGVDQLLAGALSQQWASSMLGGASSPGGATAGQGSKAGRTAKAEGASDTPSPSGNSAAESDANPARAATPPRGPAAAALSGALAGSLPAMPSGGDGGPGIWSVTGLQGLPGTSADWLQAGALAGMGGGHFMMVGPNGVVSAMQSMPFGHARALGAPGGTIPEAPVLLGGPVLSAAGGDASGRAGPIGAGCRSKGGEKDLDGDSAMNSLNLLAEASARLEASGKDEERALLSAGSNEPKVDA